MPKRYRRHLSLLPPLRKRFSNLQDALATPKASVIPQDRVNQRTPPWGPTSSPGVTRKEAGEPEAPHALPRETSARIVLMNVGCISFD